MRQETGGYAYYRLPGSRSFRTIISEKIKTFGSIDEVKGEKGFLTVPFRNSDKYPIILIPASEVHTDTVPEEHSSFIPVDFHKTDSPDEAYRSTFDRFHDNVGNGFFTKLVLSRTRKIDLTAGDEKEIFFSLCRRYPQMMVILFHTHQTGTWIAATPELLFERKGELGHTMALAGTMTGKIRDNQWNGKCRREQQLVEEYITGALESLNLEIVRKDGPVTSYAGHLSHLKTDIWFHSPENLTASILSSLHPTPAVCGIPSSEAAEFIADTEKHDREYFSGFAGPLRDGNETHLYVLLRCARISDDHKSATLFAGGGILPQSDCLSEFLETEHKMETIASCLQSPSISSSVSEKTLHFKKPARTSRGEYTEHKMLIVTLSDGTRTGIGECAPLPDLSCDRDAYHDIGRVLELTNEITRGCCSFESLQVKIAAKLKKYPALRFALESAAMELFRPQEIFGTAFAGGKEGIPINGLVWMSDFDTMAAQAEEKICQGFTTIKLKIGAIGWDREMELIRKIRSRFTEKELILRVDANGAFSPAEAPRKLEELSHWGIHSIEQPIRQGQWTEMAELCSSTPVPIALDEELIGVNDLAAKKALLEAIRPQFIVVKPTLHGGLSGAREWIDMASKMGIGSWITSALESNIGLKSISLLTASIYGSGDSVPAQGLGTGQLFTDNIDNGIEINNGYLTLSGRME